MFRVYKIVINNCVNVTQCIQSFVLEYDCEGVNINRSRLQLGCKIDLRHIRAYLHTWKLKGPLALTALTALLCPIGFPSRAVPTHNVPPPTMSADQYVFIMCIMMQLCINSYKLCPQQWSEGSYKWVWFWASNKESLACIVNTGEQSHNSAMLLHHLTILNIIQYIFHIYVTLYSNHSVKTIL